MNRDQRPAHHGVAIGGRVARPVSAMFSTSIDTLRNLLSSSARPIDDRMSPRTSSRRLIARPTIDPRWSRNTSSSSPDGSVNGCGPRRSERGSQNEGRNVDLAVDGFVPRDQRGLAESQRLHLRIRSTFIERGFDSAVLYLQAPDPHRRAAAVHRDRRSPRCASTSVRSRSTGSSRAGRARRTANEVGSSAPTPGRGTGHSPRRAPCRRQVVPTRTGPSRVQRHVGPVSSRPVPGFFQYSFECLVPGQQGP